MNIAVILAGGVGKRTNSIIPKQFIKVNDKPIIVHTLEKFNNCIAIDEICVVCVREWIDKLKCYADKYDIDKLNVVCEGGETGLASLKMGLSALNCNGDDLILIHDAVRPFITENIILDNIKVAKKHGVAMTAVDCVETLVYKEDDGLANKMIPRDNLCRIQTPQTFKYSILEEIDRDYNLELQEAPSMFALYMKLGNSIYCSQGNERNIKITFPDDVEYFKELFSRK